MDNEEDVELTEGQVFWGCVKVALLLFGIAGGIAVLLYVAAVI